MNEQCQWCQSTSETIDSLEHQLEQVTASLKDMVHRNAVLRQRPDLPADRLPAINKYKNELVDLKDLINAMKSVMHFHDVLTPAMNSKIREAIK